MGAAAMSKSVKQISTQAGLSLVELMVALVIALILIGGVIQIFIGSNQTYRFNEGASRVQENIRFGMETLQRDIRMAGFAGCTKNINNWLKQDAGGYERTVLGGAPITGWEFAGTGVGETYAIGATGSWSNGAGDALPAAIAAQAVSGSDIFVVNRSVRLACVVTGQPSLSAANLDTDIPCDLSSGDIIVTVTDNCSGGDMFQPQTAGTSSSTLSRGVGGSPGNTVPASVPFGNAYNNGGSALGYRSTAYYIREAVRPDGTTLPALYQARLNPDGSLSDVSELVESVENMQILYGVDDDGDRRIDQYVTARVVTDWEDVLGVRLSLLLRSTAQVNVETDTRTYTLLGTVIDPVDDRRIRQISTTTVGVRNRLD